LPVHLSETEGRAGLTGLPAKSFPRRESGVLAGRARHARAVVASGPVASGPDRPGTRRATKSRGAAAPQKPEQDCG